MKRLMDRPLGPSWPGLKPEIPNASERGHKWPLLHVALSTRTKKAGPEEHCMGSALRNVCAKSIRQRKRAGQVWPARKIKTSKVEELGSRPRSGRLRLI